MTTTKQATLFCTNRAHKHDDLVEELMRLHTCQSKAELHRKLVDALAWAKRHQLRFHDGFGDYEYDGVGGYTVRAGQLTLVLTARWEHDWKCPTYARLLKAALALVAHEAPAIRRDVETPRRGQARLLWDRAVPVQRRRAESA